MPEPGGHESGRRQRKKDATRNALRSAAVRLVRERGLDCVTVEDITEAADVSYRTFFNHFTSKEQALTAPDQARLALLQAALAERPADEPPLRSLLAVLRDEVEQLSRRRGEWLDQLAVITSDPRLLASLAASWYELENELASGLVQRLGSEQAQRAEVLAAVAVAAVRVAIRRWNTGEAEALPTLLARSFEAVTDLDPATASRS